ncbi:MAG TPA: four helix bundle protein [Chloroflexota bacterium]
MGNGYRDLRVWQAGIDLVELIYRATNDFPPSEVYGRSSQMRRAAVSIPSNIAEGHARDHLAEYIHHLSIAQGSLAEVTTQVEIAIRLTYLTSEEAAELLNQLESLGKQLHKLHTSMRLRRQPSIPIIPISNTQTPTPTAAQC